MRRGFASTSLCRPRCTCGRFAVFALAVLCFVAAGSPLRADELLLGIEGNYTHNSNYFAAANDPDSANSFQFGPSVELDDRDGRFRYDLDFNGAYQVYADQSGVDAWESRLRARATFDLTELTRIRVTERFRDVSNLRFSRQDIALADTALDPNQDRYFRNEFEVELVRDMTELLQLRLRGEHYWIDFDRNIDRNDSTAWEGGGELRYQLATPHFVGLGASYTRQDFENALSRLGSIGETVRAFASWTWNVSDAITFTANGGPAWISSDEDKPSSVEQTRFVGGRVNGELFRANREDCQRDLASNCDLSDPETRIPATDLGGRLSFPVVFRERVGKDDDVTFFGGVSLDVQLSKWLLSASYQRRQSTTSGDGLVSSHDRITLDVEYTPPKYRWSLFVAGSWDRRKTLTDATVIDFELDPTADAAERQTAFTEIESRSSRRDNFTAIAGYRYRLERNFAATLDGRYRHTDIDQPGQDRPGIDTFFFVLTFAYTLDPITL